MHLIEVETERTLRFADLESLAPLGVEIARYHTFEYQATQAIAAAAYFLEFDSLMVPSARFQCANLVIFTERVTELVLTKSEAVDWDAWRGRRIGDHSYASRLAIFACLGGEVVYEGGRFARVDRDAALHELHQSLQLALTDDEVERRQLSKTLLPHVWRFYDGYFDPETHPPYCRSSSRV